jgi:hypothetical protein
LHCNSKKDSSLVDLAAANVEVRATYYILSHSVTSIKRKGTSLKMSVQIAQGCPREELFDFFLTHKSILTFGCGKFAGKS